jgi:3'5'-cyclic nucleotide phosphodiesterase
MQTNSLPGKIMCSQKTRDYLDEAGLQDWTIQRDDVLEVKGKGQMCCYWITLSDPQYTLSIIERRTSKNMIVNDLDQETARQVSWLSEIFVGMINDLLHERKVANTKGRKIETTTNSFDFENHPRNEVTETINLPMKSTDPSSSNPKTRKVSTKQLVTPEVSTQLTIYIDVIAKLYRNNPFHNFRHACHVVMATKKMLSRIAPSCVLSSDSLTLIAILFSALIHDVDHPGVSNLQLCIEKTDSAVFYDYRSVSEQNSISIAWDLLMESDFDKLRAVLMPTEVEIQRFRQVVVNCVIATDLFDSDLEDFREKRWSTAFESEANENNGENNDNTNRQIAIIMEQIIQASDVSHTMQHWHVYQEWNHKLFHEMYSAFQSGRQDRDPSIGWYEGELFFFDNYIIPLAHKMRRCGVFGVSCNELLDYAVDNRVEWALKGKEIVKSLVETYSDPLLMKDK